MIEVPFHIQRVSLIDNVGTDVMDPDPSVLYSHDRRVTEDPRDASGATLLFGAKRPWIIPVFDLSERSISAAYDRASLSDKLITELRSLYGATRALKLIVSPLSDARITPSLHSHTTVKRYLNGEPNPLVWEVSGPCALTHISSKQPRTTDLGIATTHISGIVSGAKPQPLYTRPSLSIDLL